MREIAFGEAGGKKQEDDRSGFQPAHIGAEKAICVETVFDAVQHGLVTWVNAGLARDPMPEGKDVSVAHHPQCPRAGTAGAPSQRVFAGRFSPFMITVKRPIWA